MGSWLFGSAAGEIIYGALTTPTSSGLPTYGEIVLRLKPTTIESRTSFLEMNSFDLDETLRPTLRSTIPPGHRAVWDNREELAIAKYGSGLHQGQSEGDWEHLMVVSDGTDRNNDDFIEAHIYGGISSYSVDDAKAIGVKPSRTVQFDMDAAIELFHQRSAQT